MQQLLADMQRIQEFHTLKADYEKTLLLLAALQRGEVSLSEVTLAAGGWSISRAAPAAVIVEEAPADPPPAP